MSEKPNEQAAETDTGKDRRALELIQNALRGLRYGELRVVLQDGVVVQVERTEKLRPRVPMTRSRHHDFYRSPIRLPTFARSGDASSSLSEEKASPS